MRSGVELRQRLRAIPVIAVAAVIAPLAGCATTPIPGGKLVRRDYRPPVVVAYEAEGDVVPGTRHFLVQQGPGLAFFEQTGDGAGLVLERRWTDAAGDHFAVWANPFEQAEAVEVLVPLDRAQPAYRFVYPPGYYDVKGANGVEHPIPRMLIEASARLRPVAAR